MTKFAPMEGQPQNFALSGFSAFSMNCGSLEDLDGWQVTVDLSCNWRIGNDRESGREVTQLRTRVSLSIGLPSLIAANKCSVHLCELWMELGRWSSGSRGFGFTVWLLYPRATFSISGSFIPLTHYALPTLHSAYSQRLNDGEDHALHYDHS